MDGETRGEGGAGGPLTERGVGDEVAGAERRERAASGGFVPKGKPRRTASTHKHAPSRVENFTGEQRLLLLDCWLRSKLPATEFSGLVGVTATTLYAWRRKFEEEGPAGLVGHKRGCRGSQLPEPTKRAILMMKEQHEDWGQDRIHDMLIRSDGLEASAGAVQRVLIEAGYEVKEAATPRNPPKVKRFERTRPNELWQTDRHVTYDVLTVMAEMSDSAKALGPAVAAQIDNADDLVAEQAVRTLDRLGMEDRSSVERLRARISTVTEPGIRLYMASCLADWEREGQ